MTASSCRFRLWWAVSLVGAHAPERHHPGPREGAAETMPSSTWDLIHAERRRLINDLEPLTAEQWRTESLCAGWDVHQVLAHLVALTKQTPPKFVGKFV